MNSSFDHRKVDTNTPTTLFTPSPRMNLNAFPDDHINTFDPHPNYHSSSCHHFFNYYDPARFFHPHQYQPDDVANYDTYNDDGGYNTISNNIANNLELRLWQKEEHGQDQLISHSKAPAPDKPKKVKNPSLTSPMDQKPASSPETDQFSSSSSNNSSAVQSPIRVCSDCNTTKTPLWRSGPKGPKSLCNACGIRQRKARRAMAAAAAGTGTNQMTNGNKLQQRKDKMLGPSLPIKKRCRTNSTTAAPKLSLVKGEKKSSLEDVLINLSKKFSVVHRVFPDEEKDAAILLMALSYGLVHG